MPPKLNTLPTSTAALRAEKRLMSDFRCLLRQLSTNAEASRRKAIRLGKRKAVDVPRAEGSSKLGRRVALKSTETRGENKMTKPSSAGMRGGSRRQEKGSPETSKAGAAKPIREPVKGNSARKVAETTKKEGGATKKDRPSRRQSGKIVVEENARERRARKRALAALEKQSGVKATETEKSLIKDAFSAEKRERLRKRNARGQSRWTGLGDGELTRILSEQGAAAVERSVSYFSDLYEAFPSLESNFADQLVKAERVRNGYRKGPARQITWSVDKNGKAVRLTRDYAVAAQGLGDKTQKWLLPQSSKFNGLAKIGREVGRGSKKAREKHFDDYVKGRKLFPPKTAAKPKVSTPAKAVDPASKKEKHKSPSRQKRDAARITRGKVPADEGRFKPSSSSGKGGKSEKIPQARKKGQESLDVAKQTSPPQAVEGTFLPAVFGSSLGRVYYTNNAWRMYLEGSYPY